MKRSLHPDKRKHGACLERLLQTEKTAPLAPLIVQNATTKPVNVTQTCSVVHNQQGMALISYMHLTSAYSFVFIQYCAKELSSCLDFHLSPTDM